MSERIFCLSKCFRNIGWNFSVHSFLLQNRAPQPTLSTHLLKIYNKSSVMNTSISDWQSSITLLRWLIIITFSSLRRLCSLILDDPWGYTTWEGRDPPRPDSIIFRFIASIAEHFSPLAILRVSGPLGRCLIVNSWQSEHKGNQIKVSGYCGVRIGQSKMHWFGLERTKRFVRMPWSSELVGVRSWLYCQYVCKWNRSTLIL